MKSEIVVSEVEKVIFTIRGQKVILDADLAQIYGVKTKVFNQAVRRNSNRFPEDFMIRLTHEEMKNLNSESPSSKLRSAGAMRSQFVTASRRNIRFLPLAFTEHGAIMAASVLNTSRAIDVSVSVVRAFIRLREILASNKDLARKLEVLEQKYDSQFKVVFDAIRQLMRPPQHRRRRIGFHAEGS
jgi:hypothetical protein